MTTPTMRAVAKERPEPGLTLVSRPVPAIGPDEALIRVTAVGVCGTDFHIYSWDRWSQRRITPPLVVGHEFVGHVEAIGEAVRHVQVGERVSGEGHITCGHCRFCRTGQGHICRDVEIIGVDRDGCFAEFVRMPADNLWPVPPEIPDRFAAIFDPLGNAMHTVTAASISGRSVAVIGCGPIGLFSLAIARAAGAAFVAAVDPNPYRRGLAAQTKADLVLDPTTDDVEAMLRAETSDLGPEVVLEMSGHPDGLRQAFHVVRNGGDVVLLGIPSEPVAVDWAEDVIFKAITIHAVSGRRLYDTWYQCQGFLLRNRLHIEHLITHEFALEEFEEAFALMRDGRAGKIILRVAD